MPSIGRPPKKLWANSKVASASGMRAVFAISVARSVHNEKKLWTACEFHYGMLVLAIALCYDARASRYTSKCDERIVRGQCNVCIVVMSDDQRQRSNRLPASVGHSHERQTGEVSA